MLQAYFICISWGIMYYLMSHLTKIGLSYSGFLIISLPITLGIIIYGTYNGDYINDLKLINFNNILLIIGYLIFNLLGNFLVFMAMKTVDPFTVSILELLYPVVILLLMILTGESQFKIIHFIGFILAFSGIILILK
jgi:drug/metabolite transporter (DMT)-like permease